MKENMWRLIVWGTVALLSGILGVIGFLQNNNSVNEDAKVLNDIVTIFNSSSIIKEYERVGTTIKAKVKKSNIIIEYRGASEIDYEYNYTNGILSSSFNISDGIAHNIMYVLADSIGVYNGEANNQVYELFGNTDFSTYNINDGIELTYTETHTNVKLNTNKAIKIKEPINDEPLINNYFTTEDFNEKHKENYLLLLIKENMTFIRENEKQFTITEKDTLSLNTYESLKNILKYFYGEEYMNKINNLNFEEKVDYTDEYLTVMFNPEKNEFESANIKEGQFIRVIINN